MAQAFVSTRGVKLQSWLFSEFVFLHE